MHLRRNGMSKTIAFGIRLEPITVELVRKIATQRGISASQYIRDAIHAKLLADIENYGEGRE